MSKATMTELIEDAHRVLDYAARAGRLADDSLANAIRDAEASTEENQVPNITALSKALNAAVVAIAPLTLIDLRSGRSPFDQAQYPHIRRVQYGLCAVTVLLALLIAFYSYAALRQESALREYQEIQAAQIPAKISTLRLLVQQDKVFDQKDSRYEQYLRSVREIRELEWRRQSNQETLQHLLEAPSWPLERPISAGLRWMTSPAAPEATALTPTEATAPAPPPSPYEADDVCKKPFQEENPRLEPWRRRINLEIRDEYCFARALNLGFGTINYIPVSDVVGSIRDRMVLHSTWILPSLSGLLGAAVFLLRDSLNPLTANFGLARAVVRMSIGGVAGIIIGWFWSPSSLMGTDLGKVSSVPLALAFLAGYSIDILFFALERIRSTLITPQDTGKRAVVPGG